MDNSGGGNFNGGSANSPPNGEFNPSNPGGTFNGFNSSLQIPPNFDFNSLPPGEREILLQRLQYQQQQQQMQIQRARLQAQNNYHQRMTMNAYTTPRPPLTTAANSPTPSTTAASLNPQQQQQYYMMAGINGFGTAYPQQPQHNLRQNPPLMTAPAGINPALLQSLPPQNFYQNPPSSAGINQINPQKFQNPLSAMKNDPVLFNTANNLPTPTNLPAIPSPSASGSSIPPFDNKILSSEATFVEHLIKFYDAIKFTNRAIPQIANRPISLYNLFRAVNILGGFGAVGEARKWPFVTQSIGLPGTNYDVVSTVRATYYTFLYAYEQFTLRNKPLDRIDYPAKASNNQPIPTATPSQPPQSQASPQAPTPIVNQQTSFAKPASLPAAPKLLKFIPDSEISLWKPFADAMKIPILPVDNMEAALLDLACPYFILRLEALIGIQKLLLQGIPKDLQSAGLSLEILPHLFDTLRMLWNETVSGIPLRKNVETTMESFWAQVDIEKRSIIIDDKANELLDRDLMVCRLIVNLLRILAVSKGSDVLQLLAKSEFITGNLIPFCLLKSSDWELYKDALIVLEAVSCHVKSDDFDDNLLKWTFSQCKRELLQVRQERLTAIAAKFACALNFDRLASFDNLTVARQSVSALITQCAQLWKSVPAHIFSHLSTCLCLLTTFSSIDLDLQEFVTEVEHFVDIFILPSISLLRSVKSLYECTNSQSQVSQEELRRILETVIYSPAFSLTDGGFIELCLQILVKCQEIQPACLQSLKWTGIYSLMRELREFWRHSDCENLVATLGKVCYQLPPNTAGPGVSTNSPTKRANISKPNNPQILSILHGSFAISSVFSHPFLLLIKTLSLLVGNFALLPTAIQLDLLELVVEWNVDTPSKWGRQVLESEKFGETLRVLREFYL